MEAPRQGENFIYNIAFLLSLLQDEVQNSSPLDVSIFSEMQSITCIESA
jgi:hypothetical protein